MSNQHETNQRLDVIETQLHNNNVSINNNKHGSITLNDIISNCSFPIDNIADLETFNGKILGDKEFHDNLVKNYLAIFLCDD